jgi:hypothetical protein
MTNFSKLSQSNKIIIFHGLNNNLQGYGPLRQELEKFGFETEIVTLPCHGENRYEARNYEEALRVFTKTMKRFEGQSYHALAYSHGALYLQLWMENQMTQKPIKQVLLAPALFIRRQSFIVRFLKYIPSFFYIISLQPSRFRRYSILSSREYNILVQGIVKWQKLKRNFRVPSKIFIDPSDELVHAELLKEEVEKINQLKVEYLERADKKLGLGGHHIIYHPDYFTKEAWDKLIQEIVDFYRAET